MWSIHLSNYNITDQHITTVLCVNVTSSLTFSLFYVYVTSSTCITQDMNTIPCPIYNFFLKHFYYQISSKTIGFIVYVYFPILVVQILSFRCDIVPVFTIPIVSLTVMYNSIHLINDANGVLLRSKRG